MREEVRFCHVACYDVDCVHYEGDMVCSYPPPGCGRGDKVHSFDKTANEEET